MDLAPIPYSESNLNFIYCLDLVVHNFLNLAPNYNAHPVEEEHKEEKEELTVGFVANIGGMAAGVVGRRRRSRWCGWALRSGAAAADVSEERG